MTAVAEPAAPPLVVLLVDEQEWATRAIETVLPVERFTVHRVSTGQQALAAARTVQPDIIVLDQQLPDSSGVAVCWALRHDPQVPVATPVVIISTSAAERRLQQAALEAGAWDVWQHPLEGELLRLKIETYAEAGARIRGARRELQMDLATGTYTPSGLRRRGAELCAEMARFGFPVSCVAVADGVEPAGASMDAPASLAAGLLAGVTRAADVVGRAASGELLLLAPGTDARGTEALVHRIRDHWLRITSRAPRIGTATITPSDERAIDRLLDAALQGVA